MSEEKTTNDIFASLKQLVINSESLIRDCDSIQTLQESLQRLEENDENFYKYELVKFLKRKLNDKLGSYVDATIEQYPANRVDLNHAEMIDNMISKLIYSTEYLKLSKKLKTKFANANDHLLNKYDSEIGNKFKSSLNTKIVSGNSHSINLYNSKKTSSTNLHLISSSFKQSQQEAQAIFNDNHLFSMQSSEGESFTSSLFNPESCVFLNQDELVILADDLMGKNKSFVKRQEALNKLLKMPVIDIHCWDVLGPGLIDSLNEPELYNLAIKFIVKGFMSTSINIKALYCILVRQLELLFTIKKYQLPTIRSGIDIRRKDIQRILISFRLINEFQQNVIHFWVRYSEKFLEDILESTLKLFSITYKSLSLDSRLTPLHFLSLIDPKAEWMTKWMHGTYSRIPLLRFLEKYKGMLEESLSCCLRYFSIYSDRENKPISIHSITASQVSDSSNMSYSSAQIDYIHFIHSISIIGRMLMYKSYRTLFAEILSFSSYTISMFMSSLFVFWFKTPQCPVNDCIDLDTHTILYSFIKTLVQDEEACKYCFCNMEFLAEIFRILTPLKTLDKDELEIYLNKFQSTLCRLCSVLSEMIQYKSIRDLFLSNTRSILISQSAVELFGELIHKNVTKDQLLPETLLSELISIVCQFYNGCVELHPIWDLNIHVDLVRAWKDAEETKDRCITPTKDKSTRKIFQISSWEESLSSNLLYLAKTRRGVLFLDQLDAISNCLCRLLAKSKPNQIQIDRLSLGNIDLVINQISSTKSGIEALVSYEFIQRLIIEIWSLTECDSDDFPTYQGSNWPIQSMNMACFKPLVKLIAIHSSYSAFHFLIKDRKLPMEDYYSFREVPKTLIGFIDRLVIINKSSKIRGLFNFESSHLCGLCWLSATVANLNCLLLLESQYKFIKCLIDAQNENKTENMDYVILDALSVERNNIIIKSLFLAGPSERKLFSKRLVDITEKDILSQTFTSDYSFENYFRCPQVSERGDVVDSFLLGMIRKHLLNDLDGKVSIKDLQSFFVQDIRSDNIKHCSISEFMTLIDMVSLLKTSNIRNNQIDEKADFKDINEIGKFSKFEELGIKMIVDYGKNLKLFPDESTGSVERNFKLVLTNTKYWLSNINSSDDHFADDSLGFDWFSGCIFLLYQGNERRCIDFLYRFHSLNESTLMWPMKAYSRGEDNSLLIYICHWIEIIIANHCPAIHSSFQICGYPLTEVCAMWFSQCFLNIFNWWNIVTFITSNILFGPSFSIYFCVALLKHLEPSIKARLHNNDLILFIREIVIDDFNLHEKIDEIMEYKTMYDELIFKDTKGIYDCILK